MIAVKLGKCLIDPTTGTAYFETEEEATETRDKLNEALNNQRKPEPTKVSVFPIQVLKNGRVMIREQYVKFSPNQRTLLKHLQLGNGKCSRLEVMNAIYSEADQMTRLADPERSMYDLRYGLNKKLERFGLYVEIDPDSFILEIFSNLD